jgi:hypothetical protein
MTLAQQVLKNSGFSKRGREALGTWMNQVETLVNELKADHNVHRALTTANTHGSGNDTSTVTSANVTLTTA